MARHKVLVLSVSGYDRVGDVADRIFEFLNPSESRTRVLVKPNLVLAARPEQAATTHPEVTKTIALKASEYFEEVAIAEGSGSMSRGETPRVYRDTGTEEALGNRFPLVDLNKDPIAIESKSKHLEDLHVGRGVTLGHPMINVPKLKTHSSTILSAAVKNLHGCIAGSDKKIPHARFKDRMEFGRYLLELYQFVKPDYTIVDGILAMDGEGPTSGRPVPLNLMLAGRDSLAVDFAIAKLVGFDPGRVPLLKAAMQRGVASPDDVELVGEHLPEGIVFDPPSAYRYSLGLASRLLPNVNEMIFRKRRHPEVAECFCKRCGECAKNCPVGAITMVSLPTFNYRKCIRCWCCNEFCPEGAIRIVDALDQLRPSFGYEAAGSYEEMLQDEAIDAVVIATPNHLHHDMVIQAARAGKHVFVEKPLANTAAEAKEMIEECTRAGVILSVGHDKRRLAEMRELKKLVETGQLGKVVAAHATTSQIKGLSMGPDSWRFYRDKNPGGPLLQSGIHHADTLIRLFGRPRKVSAMFGRLATGGEFDDIAQAIVEFETGVLASIASSYASQDCMRIDLYGTRANAHYEARLDGSSPRLWLQRGNSRQDMSVPRRSDPVVEELEEFRDCVRTGGKPEVGGEQALDALAIVEAAIRSSEYGRPVAVVEVIG